MPNLQCGDETPQTSIDCSYWRAHRAAIGAAQQDMSPLLVCETLIVDRAELERVLRGAGFGTVVHSQDYVVLGTVDRRAWRRGFGGDTQLLDIREHIADFKKYLKVEVVPAHRERSSQTAG